MNGENKYELCKIKEAAGILRISSHTLRQWDKEGKIRSFRTPSNIRRFYKKDVFNLINGNYDDVKKQRICYCRVSSKKQHEDLTRQENFFKSKYPDHKLVTDIGSGINWKRKGLQTILERSMQGLISEVVVAHRDRLCRFAFELLEWILTKNGVTVVVLDETDDQSSSKELADDIMSIIHVYSCKQMGRRRYANKKNSDLSNSESSEND